MLKILLTDLSYNKCQLWGATLGKQHHADLLELVEKSDTQTKALTFLLNFKGIETTSPSYLKQLLTPFFESERERSLIPLVSLLSEDVRTDLEVFLSQRGWVLREVTEKSGKVIPVDLIGEMENTALETLKALEKAREASAADLHRSREDLKIAQTAWSNRLTTLNDLLLAVRTKVGRVWIYKPTITT